jgi:hypothetical protein
MAGARWTAQEIADLKALYLNKSVSFEQLEQRFGRCRGTIKQQARRLGLQRPKLVWNEQDIADLCRMYVDEDVSIAEMTGRFDCTWRVICHKAEVFKLCRPRPNTRQVKRDYFHSIDTNEKAYWLGFLAADGTVYIGGRQHAVRLDLQPRDLHWLTRFRDTIAPGAKITQHAERSFSVSIGSREMVQDLVALGIGPRKSNTLEWPHIPEPFVKPFLLGYFDGDGSFSPRSGRRDYQWLLLGTFAFLSTARRYIQDYAGVVIKEPVRAHRHTSPHLYRLSANGPRAPIIDRTLNASGLGLPRKHLPAAIALAGE